ncbi:MAG: hypothetical protein ACRBB6_03195 [Neptuniibacter sp.]
MEFFLVFILSFFVLLTVAVAFAFGKPPAYRPSRAEILNLLGDVIERKAAIERWEMFLSLPINHDPELEQVRQQCLVIAYGDDESPAAGEGIEKFIFDRRGMVRIKEVFNGLEQLIKHQPISKVF